MRNARANLTKSGNKMIIIGFSTKTSKILPRIFCRHFRHCVVITQNPRERGGLQLYQFVHRGRISRIDMKCRDLKLLRAHGWRFLIIPGDAYTGRTGGGRAMTCVDYTKRTIGMRAPLVQTPDALYRHLKKSPTI